jgi:hypothetical protein
VHRRTHTHTQHTHTHNTRTPLPAKLATGAQAAYTIKEEAHTAACQLRLPYSTSGRTPTNWPGSGSGSGGGRALLSSRAPGQGRHEGRTRGERARVYTTNKTK